MDLVLRAFIEMSDLNNKKIRQVTCLGLLVNIFLALFKFYLGVWGRSQAIIADAFHSLSDMSTDLVILLGVSHWSKPADDDHPYGHGRIETIITMFIGFFLLFIAVSLGYKSLQFLQVHDVRQPEKLTILGALISIVMKEGLYRWTIKVGKEVKSSAVTANAWHHRTDALSSIPVAIAVAIAAFFPRWFFLDYVGAFIVAIIILRTAWKIVYNAYAEVIDTGVSRKEKNQFLDIIDKIEEVRSVHAIRTRKFGPGWYVDLHVEVDAFLSVRQGHDIASEVKHRLLAEGPDVLDVVVHIEPHEAEGPRKDFV
ncbi:MAG: cation diffusion facilitator family transporter [Candidatus Omnitrophica bacterium]|nr:cation diffusion facilitator family transporter [Candidatus Omnitrophota bacterium]